MLLRSLLLLQCLAACISCSGSTTSEITLTHVSFDASRELFADLNRAFAEKTEREQHRVVHIRMSHGGSGRQARAVIEGLPADFVSLALGRDVDAIAAQGLIENNWRTRLPEQASPFYSTIVLVVRRGNPHNVHDFGDLVLGDTQTIVANPKTSGGARWAYLSAYGYALRAPGGNDERARAFIRELFRRVPVLDTGARGASNSFVRNEVGDVLMAWENEAILLREQNPNAGFEVVYPSASIRADITVAWVDRNVRAHGSLDVTRHYAEFLYTNEAQEIVARHHFRSRNPELQALHQSELRAVNLFTLEEAFGDWQRAHREHFADGAYFDQIMADRAN